MLVADPEIAALRHRPATPTGAQQAPGSIPVPTQTTFNSENDKITTETISPGSGDKDAQVAVKILLALSDKSAMEQG